MAGNKDLVLEIKAQNQELKQKLAESKRELNEFKRAVKEANNGMSQASGGGSVFDGILKKITGNSKGAGGAISLLGGGLTKLAGFLGVAVGAGEMFNKMVESSNALGDEMERVQTQAGMAVTYFANSLANVDFSNFWQGLQNAITGGGEFADVLDRINTAMQQLGVKSSKIDVEIAKKELELAAIPRGSKERIKIEQEILALKQKQAKLQGPISKDQISGAKKMMQAALGYDNKQMQRYDKVFDAFLEGGNGAYEKIGNAWKILQKGNAGAAFAPGTTNIGGQQLSKKEQEEQKNALVTIQKYAKAAGLTFEQAKKQAREFYRIYDLADSEGGVGKKARQMAQLGYAGEANSLREQAAIVSRITMEKQRADKAGARAAKQQEALAKKTYTANAKTIFEMKANVAYLEEKRDKTLPSSDEFTRINNEIALWKKQIEAIEWDNDTLEGLQAQLKSVNDELARTKKGTEQFSTLKRVAKQISQEIENINMDEYVLNPKTTKEIESNIAILKKRMTELEPNSDQWNFYNQEIEELSKMLEKKPTKGSILDIESQIAELQNTLHVAPLNIDARVRILNKIDDLQRQVDQMSRGVSITVPQYNRSASANNLSANFEAASSAAATIKQDYSIGIIGYEDAKSKLEEINNALRAMGLEPIEIEIKSKGTKKAEKAVNGVAEALGATSDAFAALGQIAEDPALDVAGIIAGAIANVMFGYAQATAAAGSMGPWAWIAFAIAGLATAMATVASIQSATSGYAEGGIIGGNSYHGDKMYARVNSGEMILNGHQQRNLFNAIDEGRLGGAGSVANVEFVLRGSDLYGTLKNYSHMKAKAGRNINIF